MCELHAGKCVTQDIFRRTELLYVDVPTSSEFEALGRVRKEGCVSIYLKTTPLSQQAGEGQIELRNLARQAQEQLAANGFDKREIGAISEQLEDLAADDDFWAVQAHSLAVFVTSKGLRSYRLANTLSPDVQVSDRFHLTPLLRAITFSNTAFVLALSENAVRLVEISADLPATSIKVEDLPKNAASAVGTANLNSRSASGRIQGTEGQNVRLRQYARRVDAALRPVLSGRQTPLILAATGRLGALYHSVNSYPNLLDETVSDSPDQMSDAELANAARPVLDAYYAGEIKELRGLYDMRFSESRATSDVSDAARAATYGAVDTLLVDIDATQPGKVDEDTGAVTFDDAEGAASYSILDEIARRAWGHGARVLGVRKSDLPGDSPIAAILRYSV